MRIILLCLLLTSCSFRQFYPTAGALVGGSAGSLVGGPVGGGLGAGGGALLGEVARGNEEIQEAKETIEAISHGDVSALVEAGLSKHKTGFDAFTQSIRKILLGAAIILILYMGIPIFIAKKCSKTEAIKATRAPFKPSRPSYPRRKDRTNEKPEDS